MKPNAIHALFVGVLLTSLTACAVTTTAVKNLQPAVESHLSGLSSALEAAHPSFVATTSPEEDVQKAIERGNSEQEQAIASRDSSVMRDTSTDAYYRDMASTNQSMLDHGITAIKLTKLEWGPVVVSGANATATTYETWSTEFADG